MSGDYAFCFGNLMFRYSLPLVANKEIATLIKGLCVNTVTLSVLLSHIGIKRQKDKFNRKAVCKK